MAVSSSREQDKRFEQVCQALGLTEQSEAGPGADLLKGKKVSPSLLDYDVKSSRIRSLETGKVNKVCEVGQGGASQDSQDGQDGQNGQKGQTGQGGLSRQQKRAFQRAMSGVERSYGKRDMRFLTLTSADGAKDLMAHYRILVNRIERLTGDRLVKLGYIKRGELCKYYLDGAKELVFDYFAVRTAEGNGVLHILYVGDYVPQKWLSDNWLELHGAWDVDIRKTYGSKRAVASYIVQYCSGQHKFIRYSWSKNWVWRGFVKDWDYLKRCGRDARNGYGAWAGNKCPDMSFTRVLELWRWHLETGTRLVDYQSGSELAMLAQERVWLARRHKQKGKMRKIPMLPEIKVALVKALALRRGA